METREVDVYWTVQNGKRWSISLSDQEAWESLQTLAAYEDDPRGWTVERTRETVPISIGEVVEGEGELVELDDEDYSESFKQRYKCVHVFWQCPLCCHRHNCDLYGDPVNQNSPASNPSIWFCERGEGIVLVHW